MPLKLRRNVTIMSLCYFEVCNIDKLDQEVSVNLTQSKTLSQYSSDWHVNTTYLINVTVMWGKILPSLRHCLSIPPAGMFFSCSSSAKLVELANTSTSVRFMILCRMDTACSMLRPWVGSRISTSPCKGPKSNFNLVFRTLTDIKYVPHCMPFIEVNTNAHIWGCSSGQQGK